MRFLSVFAAAASLVGLCNGLGQEEIISFRPSRDGLQLAGKGRSGSLILDGEDWPGVLRAGNDLAEDFGRVTGKKLETTVINGTFADALRHGRHDNGIIIAGTIGKSNIIDSLIKSRKIKVDEIKGEWEAFQSQVVSNPVRGISKALVIAGSDKRGTIFGLYDISEQIGVSPWYWWADVPAQQHKEIYALNKKKVQGAPSVKYRGIFLNDEQPALTNWVTEKFGLGKYDGYTADFYTKVFELLLRLRANYLWPAEWNGIFDLDDDKNARLGDEYGIVLGTSHTEPLMRWTKEQILFLEGAWNYDTNKENMTEFLTEGVERSKNYERVYTMGMRGIGDVESPTLTAELLGEVVDGQQQILRDVFKQDDVSDIPQMWCLYKEVAGYFEDGLRVPDDITLLWADDNWGNIQRLPIGDETERKGGAGVYYHFDYVGGIRSYKWINTISLQKTWEQMHLAYEKQAREIWIVNVGDLKPLEIPISHFLDLAYDHDLLKSPDSTTKWLKQFAAREFGSAVADAAADVMNRYGMYAARRKYEIVNAGTYSVVNYDEADRVVNEWRKLVEDAQKIHDRLPAAARPAFFQLVLHPARAGYIVYDIYVTAAKNNLYARQRRTGANALAEEALRLFDEDFEWGDRYHSLLDGKWNHMMDQTHLGTDYWQQPMRNNLPPLQYTQIRERSLAGDMGVSVEGGFGVVPGDDERNIGLSNNDLILPPIDPYIPHRWIEIYSRGTESFEFKVSPHDSWVKATPSSGKISPKGKTDTRVLISIDWANAPEGSNSASINVTSSRDYGNFGMPTIHLPVNKTMAPDSFKGFVETDRTISIEAEHTSRKTDGDGVSYKTIPGYGRTLSGVALYPNTIDSQSAPSSPRLEYDTYIFSKDAKADVTVYLGTSLNVDPERPLKYAIGFDSEEPQVVQYVEPTPMGALPSNWDPTVGTAVWTNNTIHNLEGGGKKHTLKLWALEPGVVFQKIVVDLGGVRESYLGPPETPRL
ncbi:hypothetical protein AJ80_00473 [Polytolypa hystricis UAMH7299]|uniref:Gylcosyl hydrolase 115 C-terminal domain-containing protein n=1 Tax=Polytolypa hystricis (strain UAMH7299) TaxID=1447883 RepID=A0A2B7Z3W0_POLH7|nr:hypothetical protein AJ80_00473 [Polytolypa hystricis UAMH7299]